MTTNDSFVAEDNMITSGEVYVYGNNPAQALDKALNALDRFAHFTGKVASIETYTIAKVHGDRYRVNFA